MKRIPPNPEYAIPQTVLDLATKFEFPDVDPLFPAAIPGSKGGMITVTVAPADANESTKEKSDYVLTGVADELLLQEISDDLVGSIGYTMWLGEGSINLSPQGVWVVSGPASIVGMGYGSTFITGSVSVGALVQLGTDVSLEKVYVENGSTDANVVSVELTGQRSYARACHIQSNTNGTGLSCDSNEVYVEGCWFNAHTAVLIGADEVRLINNYFEFDLDGVVGTGQHHIIAGNYFLGGTGAAIDLATTSEVHLSSNLVVGAGDGIVVEGDDCQVVGNYVLASTNDNYRVTGDRNLIMGNHSVPVADIGINLVSGNDNAVYANYLGDTSAYGTDDFADGGTGTMTAPGANGQFVF